MSVNVLTEEVKVDSNNGGFGTGPEDILIPKSTSIFNTGGNTSFLEAIQDVTPKDNSVSTGVVETKEEVIPSSNLTPDTKGGSLAALLAGDETPIEEEGEDAGTGKGRTKLDKSAMVGYLKGKIEAKEYETYDDYDEKVPLDEYLSKLSEKDLTGLIDSNWKMKEDNMRSELRKEVFESLPGSLQYAAAAVAQGATEHDLQDIYAALLRVEQTRALDVSDENDQESIALTYLQATNFGDQKEIAEQVNEWKENGQLEKKVKQFKPKLDQMQEQQVQYQLQQQEEYSRQQQELQQYYTDNVYTTLKKGDVGGLKLDKKKQQEFYNGLTTVRQSPLSGKPVNSLGARLEEIQFSDKPDFELLMEVNWLLNDKEGYRNALIQLGKNDGVLETERKLKSAQQTRSLAEAEDTPERGIKKNKIVKQNNIFQ